MPNENLELQWSTNQYPIVDTPDTLTTDTASSVTQPLIDNSTERKSTCPPAKPKRHFEYFNLNCDDHSTLIAFTDCDYIDDDQTPYNSTQKKNFANSKPYSTIDDRSALNNTIKRKFFLNLFTSFKVKKSDKMRSGDMNMDDMQTEPPVAPQRYRYRMESPSVVESAAIGDNSTPPPINGYTVSRTMSPVLEESEHNDDASDQRCRFSAGGSDAGSEHVYGKVRRVPPHRSLTDEDEMERYSRANYNTNLADFGNSYYEEDVAPLSFANFNKKYSMGGVNGRIQDVAAPQRQQLPTGHVAGANTAAHKAPNTSAARRYYCAHRLGLEAGVLLIALLELLFILYQTVSASLAYDKTGDENAFAFTLTLFSFVLAIVAVILLLVGVHRRSPYFLVPHLLMQFAVFSTTFALSVYFTLLLIGGTSVTVDAIFYEDSTLGELGLAKASTLQPQKFTILAHGLNTILISLLACSLIFFFIQVWFFAVVRRCYNLFYHLSVEKQSSTIARGTEAATGKLSGTATPASLGTATDVLPVVLSGTDSVRHHYAYQKNNNN